MAQELVTAREVAASTAEAVGHRDAQTEIFAILDHALAHEGYPPIAYSQSTRAVFQLAWVVADHKRSRQVTVFHLAYALAFVHRDYGERLAQHFGSSVDPFALGCIFKILSLGVLGRASDTAGIAIGTLRWVGAAAALARERGPHGELTPEDLIRSVIDGHLPTTEHAALGKAARIGTQRYNTVLGARPLPQVSIAPATRSEIIKHLDDVERVHEPDNTAEFLSRLEGLSEDQTSAFSEHRQRLDRIESSVGTALSRIEQRTLPIQDLTTRLDRLDRRISALGAPVAQQRSSALPLAAAIVAVLMLGTAAGLALTVWFPIETVRQAATARAN